MKKWLIAFLGIFLILIGCLYLFIPNKITVSKVTSIDCVPNAVYRTLCWQDKWKKWFPFESQKKDAFYFKGDTLYIGKEVPNAVEIKIIQKDGTIIKSIINSVALPNYSAAIEWKCEIPAGMNPIDRLSQYFRAKELKINMTEILNRFTSYLQNKENIYGAKIELSTTMDTVLITTQSAFKSDPSTADVYGLLKKLHNFISNQDRKETDYPMLNITLKDSFFRVTVAIPVNKSIRDEMFSQKDNISQKRMVPGHYMTAMITGGDSSINEIFRQLKFYFLDYSKSAVAIPYQLLITDRSKETDTSKWITKIYAPVY